LSGSMEVGTYVVVRSDSHATYIAFYQKRRPSFRHRALWFEGITGRLIPLLTHSSS